MTSQKHEDWSIKIVTDSNTGINRTILEDNDKLNDIVPLGKRVKFPKWIKEILSGIFPLYYIKEIISSQLDADRLDYLLRDAYMCGVDYARFDLDWIMNNINVGEIKHERGRRGIIINADKGIYSLESFIISRYHMYEQVYFHKTTRAAEKLIQMIFERLKELVDEDKIEEIGPIDEAILAVLNDNISINQYLRLDDFLILTYINKWREE